MELRETMDQLTGYWQSQKQLERNSGVVFRAFLNSMRSVSQQIKKFWRQGGGSSECSFFWDLDGGLLVDVDTIQELSLVLLANFADLSGESASEGDSVDVDSVNNHLVLNVVGHGDLDSWVDLDGVRLGSSQIVLYLEFSSVILDNWLDGEMSVYKSHFISEALYIQL
jgi:hypothetical protein